MDLQECQPALDEVLGYLNFSSGAADPRFLKNLDSLAARIEAGADSQPWFSALGPLLLAELERLAGSSPAFNQVDQARAVVPLVLQGLLPAYRDFHRRLLAHQSDRDLFQPFFVGRAFEAVLRQGPPWEEAERIVDAAIDLLNDYIGHRPVAVLRTPQRIEPYPHEWVRPIPLYIRAAGVAAGKYQLLVEQSLQILASCGSAASDAWFDLELLDELGLDPRAYDFDHPVHKRPNYLFGEWDPHHLDNQGRYRRFILREVTLDALLQRVSAPPAGVPPAEALYEAGAVLAGVMLMASGMSGDAPDRHDSSVTLATLLPRIVAYRDAFYARLLEGLQGQHGERLRREAQALRQPFAGARQHLNQRLAHVRAAQLQHVHLAQVFARMGYPQASRAQAQIVPVVSARMRCEIDANLATAHSAIDSGQLASAVSLAADTEQLLHQAIECGALVDPWNILGFQAQFSLFPALENSVDDHRVDVLIDLVCDMFGLYARLQGEAASRGQVELNTRAADRLAQLARWWDRFATLDVEGIDHVSGSQAVDSAAHVAAALGAWHAAGTASGDVAFWRDHIQQFNSPKTYALVIEALLEKEDLVASMALLIQWIGRDDQVPLEDEEHSFSQLAMQWLQSLRRVRRREHPGDAPAALDPADAARRWQLCVRFFDYLEANAAEYWEVPRFELQSGWDQAPPDDQPADDEHGLYGAAYDGMTYRDSTADGIEADIVEGGPPQSDSELDAQWRRLAPRMAFLSALARLWKMASAFSLSVEGQGSREETLRSWFARAVANRRSLLDLLNTVNRYTLVDPDGSPESLVDFHARHSIKKSLLNSILLACVESSDAARLIVAAADNLDGGDDLADWERSAVHVMRAMLRGDSQRVRERFDGMRALLAREPTVYVPLSKNGSPGALVGAFTVHHLLQTLVVGLPRLGLLAETCQLLETAHAMEQHRIKGRTPISQFGDLFEAGLRAVTASIVRAAGVAPGGRPADQPQASDADLLDCLAALLQWALRHWLAHSQSTSLSCLETIADPQPWQSLRSFIERYGADLFTPRFLNVGRLRAIEQQGVDRWLLSLQQNNDEPAPYRLLDELDRSIDRRDAVRWLSLVIEAIADNASQYRDYDATTTQSDRGELLYILIDFLRLQAGYQRFAWSIGPMLWIHDVLVRHGRLGVADQWRQTTADQTRPIADSLLEKLAELRKLYGVRLATIGDRLEQRLVGPMDVDRIRSLVRPAIHEARRGRPGDSLALLQRQLEQFTANPSGAGVEVPSWLAALEEEVESFSGFGSPPDSSSENDLDVPLVHITWSQAMAQISSAEA